MHLAIYVAIGVVLVAAAIVFKFLPARAHDYVEPDVDMAPTDLAESYGSERGTPALEPAIDAVR